MIKNNHVRLCRQLWLTKQRKVSSSNLLRLIFTNFIKMTIKKRNLLKKIKNFTINFGPQHPAAHGVLRRAGKMRCRGFHPCEVLYLKGCNVIKTRKDAY
jgi:hypothetical protein